MKKSGLVRWLNVSAVVFFIISIFASSSTCKVGINRSSNGITIYYCNEGYGFEHFNKYNVSEITPEDCKFYYTLSLNQTDNKLTNFEEKRSVISSLLSNTRLIGFKGRSRLIDSPWPMYCHDIHHTGRSPYSTIDTWDEIWCFHTVGSTSSPVIDDDGIIYVGSHDLQAVYLNGSLKWSCDVSGWIESCPVIGEDGIIYVGTVYGYFYALYPNSTLKWIYSTEGDILSSPVIGSDGTIYFGNEVGYPLGGYINALYLNGTVKWRFPTNHVVYSSPVIGNDGTVYCGSHDTYLYALYPNNGTLKWKYKTNGWIRVSPCIGDDGTIYVVSFDCYLHAVNPDGSLKWKTYMGNAGTSPTIGQDGTIYCGYTKLYAINPTNGSVKWTFDVGGTIRGGTPCNSVDGTIYVGTSDGGELIAINPDGTLKWRKYIGTCESAPAIGSDGTVYIGSNNDYLFAFGIGSLEADANGPYYGLINQHVQFKGSASGGYSPYTSWHWDFGDTHTSDEQNPTHVYTSAGNHTVTLTVTDHTSNTSIDTTFAWIQLTNDPPDKPTIDGLTNGKAGTSYNYTFKATDPDGSVIWYNIEWGDNTNTGWIGPYDSGTQITKSHIWDKKGTYIIKARAKDPYDAESSEATLKVTIPRNKVAENQLFLRFLDKFPLLERLLSYSMEGII